ncbi:MAG: transglutaminase domain-containing protein [Phycisphaerae bacterium]
MPDRIRPYQGIDQFGVAYGVMLRQDSPDPAGPDRLALENMVRVCDATADFLYGDYSPTEVRYQPGSRPGLEEALHVAGGDEGPASRRIRRIARFCRRLGARVARQQPADVRVGGSEEEVIARGSDWCSDVSRVACALCSVAGLPARIVFQANPHRPYNGHVIVEVYRRGRWGAVDPTCNVVYRHGDKSPASVWELMNAPDLVRAHYRNEGTLYANPDQFSLSAIVNYDLAAASDLHNPAVPLTEYSLRVLDMSVAGWPGGRRWLFGEEQGRCEIG